MSAATPDAPALAHSAAQCTGPKTPEGKAASSRNAVTHGLHAQETVLPHLGESRAEYDALHDGLARELRPRTAVERHYVQQIAQAMWRLRRLSRWESGLYDDPDLIDEDRINRLARVLRHDAALRRHIDRALRALRDGPTERPICQNEPPPALPKRQSFQVISPSPAQRGQGWRSRGGGLPANAEQNCQNEPAPASLPTPPELGAGGPPPPPRAGALRRARKLQQHQKCQNEPEISQWRSVICQANTE